MIKIKEKLCSFVLQKKSFKNILIKYKVFLKNGTYKPNCTFTQWSYKSRINENILQEQLYATKNQSVHIGFLNKLKRFFIKKYFSIKLNSVDKIFSGESLLLSRVSGGGRVIDYSSEQILAFYHNAKEMHDILEKRKLFPETIFNTSPIFKVNDEHAFYVEKYIFKKSYSLDDAFKYVCDTTLAYQESKYCKSYVYNINMQNDDLMPIIGDKKFCLNIISFIRSNNYYRCLCHGDLYRNNIIFDGSKYYYIDFELAGDCIFFFDVLYFAMMEYYRFNNSLIIDGYFRGEIDEYFCKLFNVHGATYKPELKKTYFFIMLYEYFCIKYNMKIPDMLLSLIK